MAWTIRLVGLVLLALVAGGCGKRLHVALDVLSDPGADLANVRTFDVSKIGGDNPLLEKNLVHLCMKELEAKGLVRDGDDPDVLLAVRGGSSVREEYVPPRIVYWHRYESGSTVRHTEVVDGKERVVTVEMPGRWYREPYSSGGYTIIRHVHRIEVLLFEPTDPDGAVLVWRGSAAARTSEPSTIRVAGPIIEALFAEFPTPSGEPSSQRLPLE